MNFDRRWLSWKLWLPLAFQTALVIAIPAQSFYTLMTGKTVVLKTVPVDPYDFLRGYSQILRYDISDLSELEKIPGGSDLKVGSNLENAGIYVVLEPPKAATKKTPQPWQAVRVSRTFPQSLLPQQRVVRGKINNRTVSYGLENYYMPESVRESLNLEIQQANWGKSRKPIVVQAKVDSGGKAVIESFWIGDRHYQF